MRLKSLLLTPSKAIQLPAKLSNMLTVARPRVHTLSVIATHGQSLVANRCRRPPHAPVAGPGLAQKCLLRVRNKVLSGLGCRCPLHSQLTLRSLADGAICFALLYAALVQAPPSRPQ